MKNLENDTELTTEDLKELVKLFKHAVKRKQEKIFHKMHTSNSGVLLWPFLIAGTMKEQYFTVN